MSMTHGTSGTKSNENATPHPSSSHGSTNSSSSSKHVKCIGRYVLTGYTLGKGNFARVETAVHTLTRAKVAVKIIETDKIKEDYVKKNLLREAQLMRRLRHPNIIRLYETMKTNNLYCLVTEIAEGGELLSYVRNDFKEKRLSEATTRPFIRQLVSALHHLHGFGIVHRDLKMENILLDKRKRNIKIVDFGLSNAAKPGGLLQTHCGSPEYAAPELFIPGREYSSEVDVWSLGVNMYAMLVGKLPFRTPRQGTKRRQKLLEQISMGLAETHVKEMGHISKGAKDLICRLLQPDQCHRVELDEVMLHPWITKEGKQPLQSFKYTPPDISIQTMVINLMSTVLEVTPAEIKDTVRRDRCDWLAAIYNLLQDQPEGRNILQRLIMDDPEEQLVDAVHYQGAMEHLRLSQGEFLDSYSPEVATVLSNATALARRQSGHRHSMSHPEYDRQGEEYASSTLPLTKREKRCHSSSEPHPLCGSPQHLRPVHPQGYMLRRASLNSPELSPEHQAYVRSKPHSQHYLHQQAGQEHRHLHLHHAYSNSRDRRILPMTPSEYPYHHHQPPHLKVIHPRSRTESAPDPLPVPWKPNLAPQNQLIPPLSGIQRTSPPPTSSMQIQYCGESGSPRMMKPPSLKEPLVVVSPTSPTASSTHYSIQHNTSKKKLKPLRAKSSLSSRPASVQLSKSIDGLNLQPFVIAQPGSHTAPQISCTQQQCLLQQIMPLTARQNSEGVIQGWTFYQHLGQPADIQAFIKNDLPSPSYNSTPYNMHRLEVGEGGTGQHHGQHNSDSATNVEISHELFSPRGVGGRGTYSSHLYSNSTSPLGSSPQATSPLGTSPQTSKVNFRPVVIGIEMKKVVGVDREDHLQQYYQHHNYQHHHPTLRWERETSSHHQHQQHHKNQQLQCFPLQKLPSCHIPLHSSSAKLTICPQPLAGQPAAELSTSMSIVGTKQQNGRQNITNLEAITNVQTNEDKESSGHFGLLGGILGKAFKKNLLKKEKSASMPLSPSRTIV